MKKLLLILLCGHLIFSCGEKKIDNRVKKLEERIDELDNKEENKVKENIPKYEYTPKNYRSPTLETYNLEALSGTIDRESSNSIKSCLVGYDWCMPSCNNPTMAWKFSTDGTFNYSTTMFGGMSAWGTWEDIGNQNIQIIYTRTSTGDFLPEKTIKMPNCKSLKIGQTIYRR